MTVYMCASSQQCRHYSGNRHHPARSHTGDSNLCETITQYRRHSAGNRHPDNIAQWRCTTEILAVSELKILFGRGKDGFKSAGVEETGIMVTGLDANNTAGVDPTAEPP